MANKPYLFHPILHVATLLEDRLRERLEPLGITPRQARILVALDRMGGASQVTLGDEFQVRASSMSTMTARLIANEYVYRQVNDTDNRANILNLTEKGRAFLNEIFQAWTEIDEFIIQALGEDEAQIYSQAVVKLKHTITKDEAG
jgi:DNA-binding MarR family transcriptional regulator